MLKQKNTRKLDKIKVVLIFLIGSILGALYVLYNVDNLLDLNIQKITLEIELLTKELNE